ncbi:MAG: acyl-CoA thioesterase [Candidatus Methanomethylophilaceae archaeon]|nr:acyl-CoA thioesterase [Candidatus Methanomethylophilaceae archaeon]MDI3542194.1 acyl-CoA thioesterase [Candidatus Methanomethylophilaceae archaeon]
MREEAFSADVSELTKERAKTLLSSELVRTLGIELESMSPDTVTVSMSMSGKHNSIETGHGGAIFSLADEAFALDSNRGNDVWVALSCNIVYHRPVKGKLITATSRKVSGTANHALYEVIIKDGERHVATFQGLSVRLDPLRA